MLTEKHSEQIKSHGLSEAEINRQLQIFRKGIPFVDVVEAASVENGIGQLTPEQQKDLVSLFDSKKDELQLLKFVPASGAATRMFKFLHQFLENYDPENQPIDVLLEQEGKSDLKKFFDHIDQFAFSPLVFENLHSKYPDYPHLDKGKRYFLFVKEMLSEEGLNYSHTPKGLIPFHRYGEGYSTAFGEQLLETAYYASSNGVANIHFTISDGHQLKFTERYLQIKNAVEEATKVHFNITYSFQKKQTDTIAVTINNLPFLDEENRLLFRPAGHGALLENLNNVDADIVFIKNIDNVVSKKYVETIAFWKKVLAGKLLTLQQRIFAFMEDLEENPSSEVLSEIRNFISEEFKIETATLEKEKLRHILNRPLRVCGVVENTGAPGGGPFLVRDEKGGKSFQIVEMSQIDFSVSSQKALVDKATHFNPVDLVCGIKNYKGEKFNLLEYSDPEAGFISEKSYHGKKLRALERPGLWNGAMAHWNTYFVEVPLITFNPVKTVNDLLNPVHQTS